MTAQELTPEALRVIERVQKLMLLADKNPNAQEAAAAANKVQEMLEAYNLDAATVERAAGRTGAREQAQVLGGMYQHQKDLWSEVARLNFCVYFNRRVRELNHANIMRWRFKHQLVGRTVNVRAAMHMGTYLETAIERLLADRLHERFDDPSRQRFGNWAASFRQGAVADITQRLAERRQVRLDEEEQKAREAMERAAAAGGSTATALTLSALVDQEHDANMDFIHGEGFSARRAARRAQLAAEYAEEERLAAEWAAAHPEEAAAQTAAEDKRVRDLYRAEQRRRERGIGPRGGYGGGARDKTDYGAWDAGRAAARQVSLDEQAEGQKVAGRIGRG